ncbi:hypothetical protein LMG7141_00943 [Ralstonia condita]|uniref:Uncharacterized protein n=1 Tax=Ralstonia condita TaxID=3058600 RepID=A0ABN9IJM4_9RALS|nr:hypothetical protein [Ralstonia sp. LMG 7141]CAJ0779881.1 hypothetical protein LMG7141_00943 [Ralstonia sp. LMG 7141]
MRSPPDHLHIDATACDHSCVGSRIAGNGPDMAHRNPTRTVEHAPKGSAEEAHRIRTARAQAERMTVIGDGHAGWVNVRTLRRSDKRWVCECRFISPTGDNSPWVCAASEEGYISRDLALSAGVLLGRALAAHYRRG